MRAIGSISCAMAERMKLNEKHMLNRARGVLTSTNDTNMIQVALCNLCALEW
jgi:hypothetical protein